MIKSISDIAYAICFSIFAVFGLNIGTEEPKYKIVEVLQKDIEIRTYPSRIAAETYVDVTSDNASSDAFKIIADYIFGANKGDRKIDMTSPVEINPSSQKIAMTSPVEINQSSKTMVMRFFMPSEYALSDLPEPNDKKVKLLEIPEATLAIIKFSGLSDRKNEQKILELKNALAETKWKIIGPSTGYYYNPPWTLPFLRKNEVAIPVSKD